MLTEKPEEKGIAPEFIKVPEKLTVREHDTAKFLVKVIGEPKPEGDLLFILYVFFLHQLQFSKKATLLKIKILY